MNCMNSAFFPHVKSSAAALLDLEIILKIVIAAQEAAENCLSYTVWPWPAFLHVALNLHVI